KVLPYEPSRCHQQQKRQSQRPLDISYELFRATKIQPHLVYTYPIRWHPAIVDCSLEHLLTTELSNNFLLRSTDHFVQSFLYVEQQYESHLQLSPHSIYSSCK